MLDEHAGKVASAEAEANATTNAVLGKRKGAMVRGIEA
jgi:hypothetical protein